MSKNVCIGCNRDNCEINGLCEKEIGSDGEKLRCVGEWSDEKFYYLKKYIEIFTTSMKAKWESLCYIDLFAGPGRCRLRNSGREVDASPFIALSTKHPFSRYIFVDLNREATKILEKRLRLECKKLNIDFDERIRIFVGDSNELATSIKTLIPFNSLSLCFIDPTGLQVAFKTLQLLTSHGKRIDLIINFPYGYGLKRNIENFYFGNSAKIDLFWGDDTWRSIYDRLAHGASDEKFTRTFVEAYQERLSTLGYLKGQIGDVIKVKHYYALIFAGKNPLVQKFLKEISRRDPYGQEKLL